MPIEIQCMRCKHYLAGWLCEAFPEGIPEAIATGEHDHTEPYEGDNGIQFEPVDGATEEETEE